MQNQDFSGTYKAIFKHVSTAVLFTLWAGTMLICALSYFDVLTK